MKCINRNHDHDLVENERPGHCNDCGLPCHFDAGTAWYHHDDPNAPLCLLTDPHTKQGHTPCQTEENING